MLVGFGLGCVRRVGPIAIRSDRCGGPCVSSAQAEAGQKQPLPRLGSGALASHPPYPLESSLGEQRPRERHHELVNTPSLSYLFQTRAAINALRYPGQHSPCHQPFTWLAKVTLEP
jgi:hypothetical protein